MATKYNLQDIAAVIAVEVAIFAIPLGPLTNAVLIG
jgi:hypothetical protein